MAILKTLPFSLEAVRQVCTVEPTKPLQDCSICSRLPEYASRFEKGGVLERDDIPDEAKRLRFFLDYGPHVGVAHVAQCPECARLYEREQEYEFLIGGSEESASVRRTTPEAIADNPMWTWLKGRAELQFDGTCWRVALDGKTNHRSF